MDNLTIALLCIAGMLTLIMLHVPIGISMAVAGFGGLLTVLGFEPTVRAFATYPTEVLTNQSLGAIPMFLLMGSFAAAAGLSSDLYRLFYALLGHYRGGLAMTTIAGCGGFGAICRSSLATASPGAVLPAKGWGGGEFSLKPDVRQGLPVVATTVCCGDGTRCDAVRTLVQRLVEREGIDEARRIRSSLLEEGCRVVAECLSETPGEPAGEDAGGGVEESA